MTRHPWQKQDELPEIPKLKRDSRRSESIALTEDTSLYILRPRNPKQTTDAPHERSSTTIVP